MRKCSKIEEKCIQYINVILVEILRVFSMIIEDIDFERSLPEILRYKKKWCIGISGGADSLCLTLLSYIYASQNNIEIYPIFIDHKLREESSTEIIPIIKILDKFGIRHNIIVWEHSEKIDKNMEKRARDARYRLLHNFCHEKGIDVLLTAHHSLDQWETFFMRLSRGSSLTGLCSIREISIYKDINIIRPLLKFSPGDIKETLYKKFDILNFVVDPSNFDEKYERVRFRKLYPLLFEKYKLNTTNIGLTIKRLQNVEDLLEKVVNEKMILCFSGDYIIRSIFKNFEIELQIRILKRIIHSIIKSDYTRIISYELLERSARKMCLEDFRALNIGGCVFRKDYTKNIRVFKEERKSKNSKLNPILAEK